MLTDWEKELARAILMCVETGEMNEEVPVELIIFELYSLALGFHHNARMMQRDNGSVLIRQVFERILNQYQSRPAGI